MNIQKVWFSQSASIFPLSDDDGEVKPMDSGSDDEMLSSSTFEESSSSDENNGFQGTPKELKQLISSLESGDIDPEYDLTERERVSIEKGVRSVAGLTSPDRRKYASYGKKACLKRLFSSEQDEDSNEEQPPSPTKHRAASDLLNNSSWFGNLLGEFGRMSAPKDNSVDYQVLNYHHVSSPERHGDKVSGFHLNLPGKHGDVIFSDVMMNRQTEVWCAHFKYRGMDASKFSTFFPRYIDTEYELQMMVSSARKVMWHGNRVLMQIQPPGKESFFAEAFTQYSGAYIHSVYPLIGMEEWKADSFFDVGVGPKMSSEYILGSARRLLSDFKYQGNQTNQVRYVDRRTAMVDIASAVHHSIIQGILFRFPKTTLERFDGFGECMHELQVNN